MYNSLKWGYHGKKKNRKENYTYRRSNNRSSNCYYLSTSNKPILAEISSISEESGIKVFLLICQVDYKFMTVAAAICSFNEKNLKGKKRHGLCPAVYK